MNKKGNTIVVTPIIVTICIVSIIVIGMVLMNALFPMILQQKLNKISEKYMFVVEKFGYLTLNEKENLLDDLENNGFEKENIIINVPNCKKTYGELIEFSILYKAKYKSIGFSNGKIVINNKAIDIRVNKCSYSKI